MNTTTAISISSNALQLLGHTPIASFTEDGIGARVASSFYETSYVAVLSMHPWKFAKKKCTLNRLVETPLNTFKYQFQKPTGCLKILTTDPTVDYEIIGDKIQTDSETLDLEYIERVDESFLPPLYREVLEFYLASKWAIPVTENATNAGVYKDAFTTALKAAKFSDGYGSINKSMFDVARSPIRIRR